MFFTLIRLQYLKSLRSTSFAKSLLTNILLGFLMLVLLGYVLGLGILLKSILDIAAPGDDHIALINSFMIYFFLAEFLYRYFIQKLPVIELESLLHLPIGKKKIIQMLLLRSFVSPLSIIAILLYLPFTVEVVSAQYGAMGALTWLAAITLTSWTIHWFMLWFKQRFEDSLIGLFVIFLVLVLGAGSSYMGWFNLGEIMKPVFDFSLTSPIPLVGMLAVMIGAYFLCFKFYVSNAYLEDLSEEEDVRFINQSIGFFSRFGLAGELANLEWKLIIRHKKSRTYLMLAGFFLLYGLIFYKNPAYSTEGTGIHWMFVFVGIFITGIFMLQYAQLFLSWNSANFDFFISKKHGIEGLVRGKYLLFMGVSFLCLLASIPYTFFGWQLLLLHICCFFFNVGILMHLIIYFSLWKPKPMDLNKGAMFNYEGVGAAQFLMILPMFLAPYAVYLPFAYFINDYAGLLALGIIGLLGLMAFKPLSQININRVLKNRYEISSSFRQEL
ncbi:hypothetical protein SAMN03080617_01105 [Algoriphagus alkaliphilus]|uniref:ABC-2 type transport system permease protein n=1 Tax=Algoriphagus alkaliphilus TaxID=279824 RepID=A0A1G5WGU4_9BACT|nr:DUF5687 family protein [Algoriphagus alkaliphilus]SDA56906.1 hypothetical protein SAMN03080617_01105 [Algoriphagus alkaliphilus]